MPFQALDAVAVGDPVRALEFGQRSKENFDDLNSRVLAIEGAGTGKIQDHFYGREQTDAEGAGTGPLAHLWNTGASAGTVNVAVQNTDHFVRITASDANDGQRVCSKARFIGRDRARSIVRARFSLNANIDDLIIGFAEPRALATVLPTHGVFFYARRDQDQRFKARNGDVNTDSSTFVIANNTWFELEIKWTQSSPDRKVECYIDSVLKFTFDSALGHNVPDNLDYMWFEASYNYPETFSGSQTADMDSVDAHHQVTTDVP